MAALIFVVVMGFGLFVGRPAQFLAGHLLARIKGVPIREFVAVCPCISISLVLARNHRITSHTCRRTRFQLVESLLLRVLRSLRLKT